MKLKLQYSPIVKWQKAAEKLWCLLDDIDTASDMFKPSDEAGYRKFYEYALRKAEERHKMLQSPDGHFLKMVPDFLSDEMEEDPAGADHAPSDDFGQCGNQYCGCQQDDATGPE